MRTRPQPVHYLACALLMLLGAVLRLYRLGFQSFWEDELYSWWASSFAGVGSVIRLGVLPDIHPPGYQLINYLAQQAGAAGEFGLRLPSALAGILAIPALFGLGALLLGPDEGIIAAALLSVLYFPIQYSQEARAYALLLLAVMVSTGLWWLLFAAPHRENKRQLRLAYALAAVVTAYLHYFGLLLVGLQAGTAVLFCRQRRQWRRLRIYALIGVAYAPWLPFMLRQFNSPRSAWIDSPNSLHETFLWLFYQLFNQRWPQTYLALGLLLLTAVLALRDRLSPRFTARLTLFGWLLLPFLLTALVSIWGIPIYTPRNMIIILPAALLLLADLIGRIPNRYAKWAATGALTALLLVQLLGGDTYTRPHKTQFREAAVVINELGGVDPLIVAQMAYPFLLDYYFARHDLPQRVAFVMENGRFCAGEPDPPPALGVLHCPTVSGDFAPQPPVDAAAKLMLLLNTTSADQFWYVHARDALLIDPETVGNGRYTLTSTHQLFGIHLYQFTHNDAPSPS